jgi:EamA-like transporter family
MSSFVGSTLLARFFLCLLFRCRRLRNFLPSRGAIVGRLLQHWQAFAVGSAFFAALTAIFAKIGVSEINSDLATLIRTLVIIVVTALLVTLRREWKPPEEVSMSALVFLVLSGIGTALSWLC